MYFLKSYPVETPLWTLSWRFLSMGMWWLLTLVMRPARGLKISVSDASTWSHLEFSLLLFLPYLSFFFWLRCGLSTSSPRSTRTIIPLKSPSPFSLLAMSVFTLKASASIRSSMPEKTFPDVSSSTGLRVWRLSLLLLCISRCGFPATKNSWKIYVKYQKWRR